MQNQILFQAALEKIKGISASWPAGFITLLKLLEDNTHLQLNYLKVKNSLKILDISQSLWNLLMTDLNLLANM